MWCASRTTTAAPSLSGESALEYLGRRRQPQSGGFHRIQACIHMSGLAAALYQHPCLTPSQDWHTSLATSGYLASYDTNKRTTFQTDKRFGAGTSDNEATVCSVRPGVETFVSVLLAVCVVYSV